MGCLGCICGLGCPRRGNLRQFKSFDRTSQSHERLRLRWHDHDNIRDGDVDSLLNVFKFRLVHWRPTKLTFCSLGPSDGWKEPHIIALLVVGVALLLLFFVWEMVFPTPLMPPHIWRDRDFTLVSGCHYLSCLNMLAHLTRLSLYCFWA